MTTLQIMMASALEVWALDNGGGAPSLYKTLAAYGRRGHRIDFVTPVVGANHQSGTAPAAPPEIEGVSFHTFHLPSLADTSLPLPAAIAKVDQKLRFALAFPALAGRKARSLLSDRAVDLFYGYEVHGVLALRRLARQHSKPFVSRFQGTVIHPHLDRPLQRLRRYEEIAALRTSADLIVMTDDGTRGDEVIERLNPKCQDRLRFWRNGLDLSHVRPPTPDERTAARAALGIADEDFVLVTATRLARWKRVDRAVSALAGLRRRFARARLVVVGDGEERASLQQLASDLGIKEAVKFVGAVAQQDVRRYLWAADVFLSTNDLSNIGNPLLEAMTAGCAIVTLDVGDTRDVIRDGETGLLLKDPGPEALAAVLVTLADNNDRRLTLGGAAAAFAQQTFWSWEARLAAEIDEVEQLVEMRRDDGR